MFRSRAKIVEEEIVVRKKTHPENWFQSLFFLNLVHSFSLFPSLSLVRSLDLSLKQINIKHIHKSNVNKWNWVKLNAATNLKQFNKYLNLPFIEAEGGERTRINTKLIDEIAWEGKKSNLLLCIFLWLLFTNNLLLFFSPSTKKKVPIYSIRWMDPETLLVSI